jgi:hypothetical protein
MFEYVAIHLQVDPLSALPLALPAPDGSPEFLLLSVQVPMTRPDIVFQLL